MSDTFVHGYYRGRWPEEQVPDGEPLWLFYEVDRVAGVVLRTVEVFPDGRIARNSVELEQQHGDECPSLIDCSLEDFFADADLDEMPREQFEDLWTKGVDTPVWFVR
jgi:hypothetical protein